MHGYKGTMLVKDFMRVFPISVSPDTSVAQVRRLMQKERIRHLPVVDEEHVIGIVSEGDIQLHLPSPATSLSVWELNYLLDRLTVEKVMTKRVISVSPECTMAEAAHRMLANRVGALPVVEDGKLIGLLTITDFLRIFVGTEAGFLSTVEV